MSATLTQLTASALVGLARKPPAWPAAPGGVGEVLAGMEGDEAEVKFLRTAGVLAFAAEAGQEPAQGGVGLPQAPCEELRAADTPRLRNAITQLPGHGRIAILVELLDLLAQRHLVLPPHMLPELLNNGESMPSVRSALQRLPGRRLRWLAALNPKWQPIFEEESAGKPDEKLWTDGSTAERTAVLTQIRLHEPDKAREMLAAALPGEPAKERGELLQVLRYRLSADDEPLLNTALADKAKGVRQQAAHLLSGIPGSALSRRMTQRLEGMLTLEKKLLRKETLEVTLPERFDPEWAKDGIEEKPSMSEGKKAFWLRQIAVVAPLAWWTEHFQRTPEELVILTANSDWADPLLTSLGKACEAWKDAAWAAALIRKGPVGKLYFEVSRLAGIAGRETTENWLTGMVNAGEYVDALTHAVAMKGAWSESFTETMLAGARRSAAKEPDYTFDTLLPAMALRIPVTRLAAAAQGWEPFLDKPYLRKTLDAFLQSVQSRKVIHEELSTFSP